MRLELKAGGRRVLVTAKDELYCDNCKESNADTWFYCEQYKCAYCNKCVHYSRRKTCKVIFDHVDWKIDEVRIE